MLVTAAGTQGATDANTTVVLPKVSFSSIATASTVTATISGTAGVTGTIDIAKLVLGNSVDNTVVALPASSVDQYTGELVITENLSNGLADSKAFRVVAPAGVVFTGSYAFANKAITGATYSDYTAGAKTGIVSTTFAANDTIQVLTNDLVVDNNSKKNVKLKFKVNVLPTATAGLQTFTIVDGNTTATTNTSGITATSAKLLSVGTSLPTLTKVADATVIPGKTTSVVPTNATGTVTYTSSNTAVAKVDTAGKVTVDANATAGATVVITAKDAATSQEVNTTITVGTAVVTPAVNSIILPLKAGWNLVSTPVNADINTAPINTAAAKSAASGKPVVWLMNLTGSYVDMGVDATMKAGQAAWVKATAAADVNLSGYTVNTAPFSVKAVFDATAKYGATWKLIGTAVATTVDAVKTATGATTIWAYDPSATSPWIGTGALAAGTGFWIK
jgi:hypothetical protein